MYNIMDLDLIYDAFAKLNILDLLYDKSEKVQDNSETLPLCNYIPVPRARTKI